MTCLEQALACAGGVLLRSRVTHAFLALVVPVLNAAGDLIAVLDVDSTQLAAFDADDAAGLEAILRATFSG